MGVSKVDFAGNTLVDLTGDSVTPETLLEGATAHNAAGEQIDGAVAVAPASNTTPKAPGTASAGSESAYARGDHVHPKQTVTKSDVGLGNVDNVKQYSATNPPPYPVTSVNGATGAVTLSASDVGAQPTITASGLLKGDGTTISAAVAEMDYMAPPTGGTTGQI